MLPNLEVSSVPPHLTDNAASPTLYNQGGTEVLLVRYQLGIKGTTSFTSINSYAGANHSVLYLYFSILILEM